eukprot:1136723-Pelagomonas_calceolata.AAC.1
MSQSDEVAGGLGVPHYLHGTSPPNKNHAPCNAHLAAPALDAGSVRPAARNAGCAHAHGETWPPVLQGPRLCSQSDASQWPPPLNIGIAADLVSEP